MLRESLWDIVTNYLIKCLADIDKTTAEKDKHAIKAVDLILAAVAEAVEGMPPISTDSIVEIASKHCAAMPTSITAIQEAVQAERANIVAQLKEG